MNGMDAGEAEYDLAGQVIGRAMKVHTKLGHGFIESIYKNALTVELRRSDFTVEREKPTAVFYEGVNVGSFTIDMLVNDQLIIEAKAVQMLVKAHEVQLVNYLNATGIDEGLLLNFGAARLEFKKKFRRPKNEPPSF
jgi:GxxExxY protein